MSYDFQRRVTHTRFTPAPDGVDGRITAKVLTYNVVDDYQTVFLPGVFRASMDVRMPRIVWSHDWAEPLGRWERYLEDDEGLTLVGQLDDFDDVPRARQAWSQLRSGTIDQFSVGFMPEEAQPMVVDGRDVLGFTQGRLDEASLVLVGAVPGTELVSLRSPRVHQREVIVVRTNAAKVEVDPETLAQLFAEVESGDTLAPAALAMLMEGVGTVEETTMDDAQDDTAQDAPTSSQDAQDESDDDDAPVTAQDEDGAQDAPEPSADVDDVDVLADPDIDALLADAGDVLAKL